MHELCMQYLNIGTDMDGAERIENNIGCRKTDTHVAMC